MYSACLNVGRNQDISLVDYIVGSGGVNVDHIEIFRGESVAWRSVLDIVRAVHRIINR